jgi:tetratricopeptide (TPR) repeat protein
MTTTKAVIVATAFGVSVCLSYSAFAAPTTKNTVAEAERHMARADRLFHQEKNYEAALAEFMEAYKLAPRAEIRYNIGLLYAEMGRPVEAVEWLNECLANPAKLAEKEINNAKDSRDKMMLRVGSVIVTTTPTNAQVKIDGSNIDAARQWRECMQCLASKTCEWSGLYLDGSMFVGQLRRRRLLR